MRKIRNNQNKKFIDTNYTSNTLKLNKNTKIEIDYLKEEIMLKQKNYIYLKKNVNTFKSV